MDWLSLLVDQAYAAALDGSLWERWAARVVQSLGGVGGTLTILDPSTKAICQLTPIGWEHVEAEYRQHWYLFDPLVPAVCRGGPAYTLRDTDHVALDRPETAEYMRWQRDKAGFGHHMAAAFPLGGNRRASLSIHRSVGDGHTPPEQYEKLKALLPTVARPIELGHRHAALLDQSYWDGVTASSTAQAAILLDERGLVRRATSAALAIFDAQEGVAIRQDRIWHPDAAVDTAVGRAVAVALLPHPHGGAVRLPRRSGRAPYVMTIFPLVRQRRALAPYEAAALVRLVDPAAQPSDDRRLYIQAFTLSEREADLAVALMKGHSPETAASAMQISVATARVHLRRLFQKSATSRQSELIRLLTQIR